MLFRSVGLAFLGVGFGGIALAVYYESIAIAVVTGAILVLFFTLMSIVTSALRQIFLAGLYEYARTGKVPAGFSEQTMVNAIRSVS